VGTSMALVWICGGMVLAGWCLQAAGPGWRQGLGALAWVGTGVWAAAAWWRSPRGALEWDGASWHFAACAAQPPRVAADAQGGMLLEVRVEGRRLWLWASCRAAPSYWEPLRRAVYSRAKHPPPQGAQPPVASP